MVFMAVGEDDAEQVRLALLDEGDVGQDELDPGIGGIGEGEAEIDHHPFALGAIEIDVHADLARAAKREEEEFVAGRSEEHTSELQSLLRRSYAVFCLKKQKQERQNTRH